jgi:hypothetical protein
MIQKHEDMILWDGLTKEGGMDKKRGEIFRVRDSNPRLQEKI